MSRSLNLAVIPGDGIGQEVVAEGLKVLSAVLPQDVKLETKEFDFGARRYHATGETLTDADLDALKAHDAILLGAIGYLSVPSGVLEREVSSAITPSTSARSGNLPTVRP
ncbi:3-isopropylmalate dehydrogenase [Streptomyces violaceorubidus]